jgi:hypothetical protein
MSKQYPECPMYNHDNCKYLHIPKVCAIIREDKICSRKYRKGRKTPEKSNTPNGLSLPPEFRETVKRIKDKEPELNELTRRDKNRKKKEDKHHSTEPGRLSRKGGDDNT